MDKKVQFTHSSSFVLVNMANSWPAEPDVKSALGNSLLKWLKIVPVKMHWTTLNVTTLKLNCSKGMFDHSGIIYSCLSKSVWLSNFLFSKPFQCNQLNNDIKIILRLLYLHDFSTCLWLWDKILKLAISTW